MNKIFVICANNEVIECPKYITYGCNLLQNQIKKQNVKEKKNISNVYENKKNKK